VVHRGAAEGGRGHCRENSAISRRTTAADEFWRDLEGPTADGEGAACVGWAAVELVRLAMGDELQAEDRS
jgi:hypothetical protein